MIMGFFFFFGTGSCELIAQGWLQTAILPISASQVARITGVIHQHLTRKVIFKMFTAKTVNPQEGIFEPPGLEQMLVQPHSVFPFLTVFYLLRLDFKHVGECIECTAKRG
jgi:hypothetical protein